MQNKIVESYTDPETGTASFGMDQVYTLKDTDPQNRKERIQTWLNNPNFQGAFKNRMTMFEQAMLPGSRESKAIGDLDYLFDEKRFDDDKPKMSYLSAKGKIAVNTMRGNYQQIFGRDPSYHEIIDFIDQGFTDLTDPRSAAGAGRDMQVRMIPTDWISEYDADSKQAIFALLNGGSITPEREATRTSGWAKFGNIAGTLVGAAVGSAMGNPSLGASLGGKAGGMAGSAV